MMKTGSGILMKVELKALSMAQVERLIDCLYELAHAIEYYYADELRSEAAVSVWGKSKDSA